VTRLFPIQNLKSFPKLHLFVVLVYALEDKDKDEED